MWVPPDKVERLISDSLEEAKNMCFVAKEWLIEQRLKLNVRFISLFLNLLGALTVDCLHMVSDDCVQICTDAKALMGVLLHS